MKGRHTTLSLIMKYANYIALTWQIVVLTLCFEEDSGSGHSGTDLDFLIWAFNFLTSSFNLAFSFWPLMIFRSSMG
jgi:hypothetical protein